MDNKIVEVFIPGPVGRMEAKYYKSNKITSIITKRQYVNFFKQSILD